MDDDGYRLLSSFYNMISEREGKEIDFSKATLTPQSSLSNGAQGDGHGNGNSHSSNNSQTSSLPTGMINGSTNEIPPNNHQTTRPLLTPQPNDVLMGTRRLEFRRNPGNMLLKKFVESTAEQYENGVKAEKYVIARTVVKLVKEKGGRFLRQSKNNSEGCWVEVDDDAAHEKISHDFRNHKRANNNSRNKW